MSIYQIFSGPRAQTDQLHCSAVPNRAFAADVAMKLPLTLADGSKYGYDLSLRRPARVRITLLTAALLRPGDSNGQRG